MLGDFKILYAEDEDCIRENIVETLRFMSANITAVENGKKAYEKYLEIKPDIIITDIEMPYLNGLELAKKIRKIDKKVQIIITTAHTDTKYFLKAIELNLAKYLVKPVTLIDLQGALKKCMQEIKTSKKSPCIYFTDNDYYDLQNHTLYVDNNEIRLDYHERKFLELLLKNSSRVVVYKELESCIWEDGMSSAALRSLVRNIRQKLPKNTIENISKMGYKIILKD